MEKINFGLHSIVSNNTKISIIVLVKYCAINAHTPNPIYAKNIPTTPEINVPNSVEKKYLLNSICRST